MNSKLNGKHIAILVTEGFEQIELTAPKEALENAGADVDIVSPASETVGLGISPSGGKPFM